MRLVGFDRLQARSAYQPMVHFQKGRWIACIGHHSGQALNDLTGVVESNGTSILDVTEPTITTEPRTPSPEGLYASVHTPNPARRAFFYA
jgi:hypothetical protein